MRLNRCRPMRRRRAVRRVDCDQMPKNSAATGAAWNAGCGVTGKGTAGTVPEAGGAAAGTGAATLPRTLSLGRNSLTIELSSNRCTRARSCPISVSSRLPEATWDRWHFFWHPERSLECSSEIVVRKLIKMR